MHACNDRPALIRHGWTVPKKWCSISATIMLQSPLLWHSRFQNFRSWFRLERDGKDCKKWKTRKGWLTLICWALVLILNALERVNWASVVFWGCTFSMLMCCWTSNISIKSSIMQISPYTTSCYTWFERFHEDVLLKIVASNKRPTLDASFLITRYLEWLHRYRLDGNCMFLMEVYAFSVTTDLRYSKGCERHWPRFWGLYYNL